MLQDGMAVGLAGVAASMAPAVAQSYELKQYVEKDPALPAFTLSRPKGWAKEETTLTQNTWRNLGKILKFSKGNLSIEVAIEPIDDKVKKLDQLGSPRDFANAFANSVARMYAPPNPANPSPVPSVEELSMEATKDLTEALAQYRLTVGDKPPLLFEQLTGGHTRYERALEFWYAFWSFSVTLAKRCDTPCPAWPPCSSSSSQVWERIRRGAPTSTASRRRRQRRPSIGMRR